jgi:hypothetical protein
MVVTGGSNCTASGRMKGWIHPHNPLRYITLRFGYIQFQTSSNSRTAVPVPLDNMLQWSRYCGDIGIRPDDIDVHDNSGVILTRRAGIVCVGTDGRLPPGA